MKYKIKLVIMGLVAAIAGAVPIYGALCLWGWCMDQVPSENEWAGMAKIGLSIVMIVVGGGAAIGISILFGIVAGIITIKVLDIS